MNKKKTWLGVLAIVLVLGMAVVGCDVEKENDGGSTEPVLSSTDPALNGNWRCDWDVPEEYFDLLILDNGNFELSGHYEGTRIFCIKGTFTTDESTLFLHITHVYGTTTGGLDEERWYTRSEVTTILDITDEELDSVYPPKPYSVSGNTLNWNDRAYTRI